MSLLEELRGKTESVLHAGEFAARKSTADAHRALIICAEPHIGYIKNRMREAAKIGAWHLIVATQDIITMGNTPPNKVLLGLFYAFMEENMFVDYQSGYFKKPPGDRLLISWKR